ncbi:MAG: nucleotidyltransferase domain-containing protein [Candidatus Kapaibacteriota bacterium]
MSKVCNPPKVLNPRTGKCVDANYLKQLNKKQPILALPLLPIPLPPQPAQAKEDIPEVPTEVPDPDVAAVAVPAPKEKKQKAPKAAKAAKAPKAAKAAKAPVDYKKAIIDNLKILEDFDKLNKEPFKARAYGKVIDSLEIFEGPINNMDDIKNINGIGEKINAKIKELIETGKMTAVERALNDPQFSLQKKLGKLYGVGPVKINELMSNISTFEELYERPELLNEKQKIGLKYYDDMNMRIPMSEGKKHYKIIDTIFKKVYKDIEFELVGSYRRQNKDMGDIDILIKNRDDLNIKKLVSELTVGGYIIETLASGKSKFMGLCKLSPELPARRIDILIADPSYYYFALLYFTGSYSFNIYMRRVALEKGWSLSEYGIKNNNTKKFIDTADIIKSEEDIFNYLAIPYVPPNKRDMI